MTPLERAMKYAEATPPAVSGAGGQIQTFSLACSLFNGFALTESEALAVLKIYNFKCQPQWSESELNHKVRQATIGKARQAARPPCHRQSLCRLMSRRVPPLPQSQLIQ
jgi:hypothetical protein